MQTHKLILPFAVYCCTFLVFPAYALEDNTPPVLQSISITPNTVVDEQTVDISVKATDDLAGIKNIYLFIHNPNGQGERSVSPLSFNSATQSYERTFTVPKYALSGQWYIYQIQLHDNAGNVNTLNHGNGINSIFQVNSRQPDSTLPALHDIQITPGVVAPGQTVRVSIQASDDLSGIDRVVSFINNPNGDGERSASSMTFDSVTQRYIRDFVVPDQGMSGQWYVHQVQVYDNAWNTISLDYPHGINATFNVNCAVPSACDSTRPTLHGIEITPNVVSDNESVTISVQATDDLSGIARVTLFVTMPNGDGERHTYPLTFEENTQRYVRVYEVPRFGQSGEWYISQIQIEDNAGNELILHHNSGINATFQVGESRLAETITDTTEREELVNAERAAILIYPRGQGTGYKQEVSIEFMAAHIYRTLKMRGYSNEEIYFLSHKPDMDINADGFIDRDVVDGPVTVPDLSVPGTNPRDLTIADVEQAFNWAKQQGSLDHPLFVAFVDHALPEQLRLDPFSEMLTATKLDALLDDYQQATGNTAIVLLEACHTGTFLEQLKGANRIIISATDNQLAYYDNLGAFSFSKFYFDHLRRGEDLFTAFNLVDQRLPTYGYPFDKQSPQLDDDGDGLNTSRDGVLSAKYCLNGCFGALSGEMTLEVLTTSATLASGQSMTLKTKVGITEGSIAKVWALVMTPESASERNDQGFSLAATPMIEMQKNTNGEWHGLFSGYTTAGHYVMTFMAQDDEGFITAANPITLTMTGDSTPFNSPKLTNISTRCYIQKSPDNAIAGFVVEGTGQKKVLLRAIRSGIETNPNFDLSLELLQLVNGAWKSLETNDNWGQSSDATEIGSLSTNLVPNNLYDAALIVALSPGTYTAIASPSSNNVFGIGVVSVDDLEPQSSTMLTNISGRCKVQAAPHNAVAGFVVSGEGSMKALLRGIRSAADTSGSYDPKSDLYKITTSPQLLESNQSWQSHPRAQEMAALPSNLVPDYATDTAVLRDLTAGVYTIEIKPESNFGIGVVSVDVLD